MKTINMLAAIGVAASSLSLATPAPAQVRVVIGDPGPGWNRWHERRYDRAWNGPAWYNGAGPHHGYYHWNNNYYQNCSWRNGARRQREWRCW